MNSIQLKQVRWIDPYQNSDQVCDLQLQDGAVQTGPAPKADAPSMDAQGLWLMPAWVDLSQHLAAPAPSPISSIEHELQIAWSNGFSTVCAQPDSKPVIDNASVIEWIERRAQLARADGKAARIHLLGALTQGLLGQQLSNMAALKRAGCIGLSQADGPLPAVDLLRQALHYANDLDLTLHLRPTLAQFPGCAHDGATATALGLSAIPAVDEHLAVATIIELVADSGCRVHLNKLSSARSVALLRAARDLNLPITASVSIWNLLHTDSAIDGYNTRYHLNPPLRSEADRQALLAGVADGSIAAVCSDHRPLAADDKFGPFADTKAGGNGVDGYLAALLSLLSDDASTTGLDALQLARASSFAAEQILKLAPQPTDWLLIDPSLRQHCPLLGRAAHGTLAGRLQNGSFELQTNWQHRLGV